MIVVGLDCEELNQKRAELEISTNSMGELVVILEALTYRANKAPGPVAPVAPVGQYRPWTLYTCGTRRACHTGRAGISLAPPIP